MTKDPEKILVLGIGNVLLSDEGVGVHAVRLLQSMELPPNVKTLDGGTAGLDLLPYIQEVDRLIVVDCMDAGDEPGTLFRATPQDLAPRAGIKPISFHQIGFLEVLQLAAHFGNCPGTVVIIGVQPASLEMGLELTPAVARRLPDIVQMVLAELATPTRVSTPKTRP